MVIELGRWTSYQGVQRRFADTRVRKIEGRIEEVLVSFAAFAAGEKVERAQARLAKLEADRVGFLEQKLMQVEERDRLAAFVASLEGQTDHPDDERYPEFKSWVQRRLAGMNARLLPEAIARELVAFEAFAPTKAGGQESGPDTQS